jgi:hypothetical protein
MNNDKITTRIAQLFSLFKEMGLHLELDTSRYGYRIQNEFGRYLTPILKTSKDIEQSLEVMYNAIREYQTI